MIRIQKLLRLFLGLLFIINIAGCAAIGFSKFKEDSTKDGRIDFTNKVVFLFPTDILINAKEEPTTQNASFFSGLISEFGQNVISGQPFKPVFDQMGIEPLATFMPREGTTALESDKWDFVLGDKEDLLLKLYQFIAERTGKNLDYVVFTDVWDKGTGNVPKTVAVWVTGIIWDVKNNKMIACVKWKDNWEEDNLTYNLSSSGAKLVKYLTGKLKFQ